MTNNNQQVNSLASANNANIGVIGAGLMGRLTALILAEQGYQVTLIDKDSKVGKNSAAYAAAGLLTPLGEAMHSEANIVEMGFTSLSLWPKILAKLSEYTFFQQSGAIMVSHPQDLSDFHRYARFLSSHYPQHHCHSLDREQLLALEPELGRSFHQGLFLPDEGQLGNRKLVQALTKQLEVLAVTWLENTEVTSIVQQHSSCEIMTLPNKQVLNFDFAIDCRGVGARTLECADNAAPLNQLRAVRGELFQLYAPNVHLTRPIRLMHPRYQLYIAPKTKGYYVVGATEIESDDRSPMTVRASMELLSAAYSIHPGFAEANIRQHVSQLRPAFNDNQPQINIGERLIQVNGLYRHGFLIAPVILSQLEFAVNQRVLKLNGKPTSSLNLSPYQHMMPMKEF